MSELARAGKTPCQGHQDPSKSVSIFDRETEANSKMVSINAVSIPRSRTVPRSDTNEGPIQGKRAGIHRSRRAIHPKPPSVPTGCLDSRSAG